jgi:peroxiredoxin family protein
MSAKPLFVVLCSAEHEKIQMAAMLSSVAAVSDRAVNLFVSMNALFVFKKGVSPDERYQGGTMSRLMRDKKVPDPITMLRQGKQLGQLSVHACSMALDVTGLKLDDLEPEVFDDQLGLTKYLADAESGELIFI